MLQLHKWLAAAIFAVTMLVQPVAAVAQTVEYLSTDEAIALEHQTRYTRLKRFVDSYNISPAPQFYQYIVPASEMPPSFAHDVPVLRIVFPENTFFATGSAVILPSAYPIIAAMASMLDGDVPDVNLFVAGHTDSRGGEDYNHNLSISRAKAVTDFLVTMRKQTYPIWSIGFGQSLPLYPNKDSTAMSYNRRVEFLLGARPEAVALWLKNQYDLVCQTGDPAEKLNCLVGLRKIRHIYEAEEAAPRIKVALTTSQHQHVANDATKIVSQTGPKRLVIQLDEHRLYVRTIEH
jgi:OOP family OmpA-OmpF porin